MRKFWSIHLILIVSFISYSLTGCSDTNKRNEEKQEPKTYLAKLLKVSIENNNDFLNYPATIKAQKLSILSFEVGGKVQDIFVKETQTVKAGEVLAKLDQKNLLTKINSARSQYDNSEAEYQRALRLIEGDAISKSELEAKKSKRDITKSELLIAQKALEDSVLRSPYDGVVSYVPIKKQQVVQAGSQAINIFGFGGMKATIDLPSSLIAKSSNQKNIPDNSYIVLDAAPDRKIPIVFKEASLEADAASQTYPVTFTFDSPKDLIILPGMNGVVWFQDPTKSSNTKLNISVPLTAIGKKDNKHYVWIVDPDTMTVSKRFVTIEPDVGETIHIHDGLNEGDTIVISGISSLSEGMRVAPWSK